MYKYTLTHTVHRLFIAVQAVFMGPDVETHIVLGEDGRVCLVSFCLNRRGRFACGRL